LTWCEPIIASTQMPSLHQFAARAFDVTVSAAKTASEIQHARKARDRANLKRM
jgi:hypothetical protein